MTIDNQTLYQVLIESSNNMIIIRIDVGIIQEKLTINTQFDNTNMKWIVIA